MGTAKTGVHGTVELLQQEVARQRAALDAYDAGIRELLAYYASTKFGWPDGDHAHVSTDIMPRLRALLSDAADASAASPVLMPVAYKIQHVYEPEWHYHLTRFENGTLMLKNKAGMPTSLSYVSDDVGAMEAAIQIAHRTGKPEEVVRAIRAHGHRSLMVSAVGGET